MNDLPLSECTTWYQSLQASADLDLRDNRGKRHDLALVLLELVMSLLRGRDGNLSSLHRSMVWLHDHLCVALALPASKAISRSQLPLTLGKVNGEVFEQLLASHWSMELPQGPKQWFAADGKTLRGSIPKGETQGQNLVQLVSHQEREVVAEAFYEGEKESEIPTTRELLQASPCLKQAISMDALHCNPATLGLISDAGGDFLVGLKENQPELFAEMKRASHILPALTTAQKEEKDHGRIENRTYQAFDVRDQYFDPRWHGVGFQTLIRVERSRMGLKTQQKTEHTAFFMTNSPAKEAEGAFGALRNHWQVEVNNHLRDVTLKEDAFRTKFKALSRVLAQIRTVVIKVLNATKCKNMRAQIEAYQDSIHALIRDMKEAQVL